MGKSIKYILLLSILFSFSKTNLAAQATTDRFKPKIKSIKEVIYRVKNGKFKNRDTLFASNLNTHTIYNEKEEPIEFIEFYTDGSPFKKTTFERNKKGDIQKTVVKKTSGELISYCTHEYDAHGNMTAVKSYDAKHNLIEIQSNKYDKNGNNTEKIFRKPNSTIERKYVYEYNSDNKIIKAFRYKPDGSLKDTSISTYDKNGNENTCIKFNPDGNFIKKEFKYDTLNNLILENAYDTHNTLRRQTLFERVYDDYGNWITNKRSTQGTFNIVCERQIEYFE
ncbi:hypothetical protein FNB79_00370 [Formosa sediminum]|uniref:RHS repeat protein n=1 Tax=Formosa sediminum TaxID=2594004 RepID=A0A516GLV0_9FLAO|nr:hypothetical protein [Formosa sediminum]QDO92504.1 hypothetical protein FNB79_00370 [Formosa sediminum]